MIAVRDYKQPTMPTEHAIRRLWRLARLRLKPNSDDPVRPGDQMKPATLALLDKVARPPACGPLLDQLEAAVRGWQQESCGKPWLRLVVLPPCDRGDLLGTWAAQHLHAVLPPPDRAALCDPDFSIDLVRAAPGAVGQLLVVPRLEDWFLRQRDGLSAVRCLLRELAAFNRPCLVGCNSWAWAFVEKAVGAGLALPSPVTFESFDADHLRDWFATLALGEEAARERGATTGGGPAHADDASAPQGGTGLGRTGQSTESISDTARVVFRLASNGRNVLGQDDDSDNGHDGFLRQLAARSLGIPWVAWHLWRQGLRAASDADHLPDRVQKATKGDAHTLWVTDLPEFTLPDNHEQTALLVLQALLIHGALTEAELHGVLPVMEEPGIIAALQTAGFIESADRDGRLHVRPAAYPAVRTALRADGYPAGAI